MNKYEWLRLYVIELHSFWGQNYCLFVCIEFWVLTCHEVGKIDIWNYYSEKNVENHKHVENRKNIEESVVLWCYKSSTQRQNRELAEAAGLRSRG